MRSVKVEIKNGTYYLLENIEYKGVKCSIDDYSDGVSMQRWWARILFNPKEYAQGLFPAFIHDEMCRNKHLYDRKESTQYLVDLWRQNGLNGWKCFLVKHSVNIFQYFKGGWKS